MNSIIIRRWNSTVRPDDLVIHLGDFALYGKSPKVSKLCKSLNGKKILVRGNHDRKSMHWYLKNGFNFVCDLFVVGNVIFTHRPLPINEFLLMPFRLNIHGHIHEREQLYKDTHKNISVEQTNYFPIKLDHILGEFGLRLKRQLKQGD
jgi:calcineurin-like phosphoesterase family protein